MINVLNLSKIYNTNTQALKDVTIELPEGEIIALLGLNGAGKSTFMKILLGLVKPTSGKIQIQYNSKFLQKLNNNVAYLPENFTVPKQMKAYSVLRYLGELSGIKGKVLEKLIDEYLKLFELYEYKKRKVDIFSKGMIIKLGIVQSLLKEVPFYFLDEPTEGLDPIARIKVRDLLLNLKSKGATVLINSHMLSEVELFADRIAILHKGKLLKYGSLSELLGDRYFFEVEVSEKPHSDEWPFYERNLGWVCKLNGTDNLQNLISEMQKLSIKILNIKPSSTSLEDLFTALVKE
jgi:ABC-2 type transport system ATP-binding protein